MKIVRRSKKLGRKVVSEECTTSSFGMTGDDYAPGDNRVPQILGKRVNKRRTEEDEEEFIDWDAVEEAKEYIEYFLDTGRGNYQESLKRIREEKPYLYKHYKRYIQNN